VEQTKLTGIVLESSPIGDYDRRVVLLTKERGRISAFARGARRQTSPLLGSTVPFCFGDFYVYEGRTSNNLRQADIQNYFVELRSDLEAVSYGFYFLELAQYYTREYNDELLTLKLLYQSLRALTIPSLDRRLVRTIYEWKMLAVNGEDPDPEKMNLDPTVSYTLRYIAASAIEKLYTFTVSEEVLTGLERVVGNYFKNHIDRKFRTLEVLEDMERS